MSDLKDRRQRQVNLFFGIVSLIWVLWLVAALFVSTDLFSVLLQIAVTVVVAVRVGAHLWFEGQGTVEKVIQKIERTKDNMDFTHNDVMVFLLIRLSTGKMKKVKFGTLADTMHSRVDVGSVMHKSRWSWTWKPIDEGSGGTK